MNRTMIGDGSSISIYNPSQINANTIVGNVMTCNGFFSGSSALYTGNVQCSSLVSDNIITSGLTGTVLYSSQINGNTVSCTNAYIVGITGQNCSYNVVNGLTGSFNTVSCVNTSISGNGSISGNLVVSGNINVNNSIGVVNSITSQTGYFIQNSVNAASCYFRNTTNNVNQISIINGATIDAYNNTTQANDAIILYGNGFNIGTGLNICSWGNNDGLRLTPTGGTLTGNLSVTGNVSIGNTVLFSNGSTQKASANTGGMIGGSPWLTTSSTSQTLVVSNTLYKVAILQPCNICAIMNGSSIGYAATSYVINNTWNTSVTGKISFYLGLYDGTYTKVAGVTITDNTTLGITAYQFNAMYYTGNYIANSGWSVIGGVPTGFTNGTAGSNGYGVSQLNIIL